MPTIKSPAELPANETRATEHHPTARTPDLPGLHPVSVIALGTSSRPVERMIGAQSTVYRVIVMLERIRLPRKLPSLRGLLTAPFAKPARN